MPVCLGHHLFLLGALAKVGRGAGGRTKHRWTSEFRQQFSHCPRTPSLALCSLRNHWLPKLCGGVCCTFGIFSCDPNQILWHPGISRVQLWHIRNTAGSFDFILKCLIFFFKKKIIGEVDVTRKARWVFSSASYRNQKPGTGCR